MMRRVAVSLATLLSFCAVSVSAAAQDDFDPDAVLALDQAAYAETLTDMFRQYQDEYLEPIAQRARETRARWDDGTPKLEAFYNVFREFYENEMSATSRFRYKQTMKGYIKENPETITARVALCITYVSDAWEARGSGYANTVTDEGWTGFYNNLETALKYAEEGRDLGIQDPELYRILITIGGALDHSERQMYGYAEDGLAADPTYLSIVSTMANFALPRWGGLWSDEKKLAEWAAEQTNHAIGDSMYFFVTRYVAEEEGEGAAIALFGLEWPRIEKAYADYKEHVIHAPRLDQMTALFACIGGDREAAQAYFAELPAEAHDSIWTQEAMDHWRAWADGSGEALAYSEVHQAAQYGNFNALKAAASNAADLQAMDPRGLRAIDYVSQGSNWPAIEWILAKGIDPEKSEAALISVLEESARDGREDMIERLLDAGIDATKSDALWYTVKDGRTQIMRMLLDKGKCDPDQRVKSPETALARAARHGQYDMIKLLVERGADVNSVSDSDWTPFLLACAQGHVEGIQYFLDHGADPTITYKGWTPLHLAASRGADDALRLLAALPGVDVNARLEEGGYTPLHLAAHEGRVQCVRVLTGLPDVDMEAAEKKLGTALVMAADAGNYDTVRLLIEKGADFNATDSRGRSALALAIRDGHEEVAKLLREHGAKE